MPGSQSYVFTKVLNGISALDMMIEFSLTGKMTCSNARLEDDPMFNKWCCNYYISLKPGRIASIEGVDRVKEMSQVLQLSTFHSVGDVIRDSDSLDRVIFRIHVMDDTKEKLARTLEEVSSTIRILSDSGEQMQIEPMTYSRALSRIERA